jgi:hypothetical protein
MQHNHLLEGPFFRDYQKIIEFKNSLAFSIDGSGSPKVFEFMVVNFVWHLNFVFGDIIIILFGYYAPLTRC